MVRYPTEVAAPRPLVTAAAAALAFSVGVAVALLIALSPGGIGDTARIARHTNGPADVRMPGEGRRIGDLTTADPTWRHVSCPPGRQPGVGGERTLTCVTETTR